MSDQGKFINTYIDTIISTLNEMLASNLQLKTQVKMSSDMLIEKDEHIARLTANIDSFNANQSDYNQTVQTNIQEISDLKSQISKLQQDLESALNKASHVESLLQQVNDMKNNIKNNDAASQNKIAEMEKIIESKEKEIETLRNRKAKSLNKSIDITELNKTIDVVRDKDDF